MNILICEKRIFQKILVLGLGTYLSANVYSDDIACNVDSVENLPDLIVTEKYDENARPYIIKNGKRFITKPYGNENFILKIAEQAKKNGKKIKVPTRGIEMPSQHVGAFLESYKYEFKNGITFTYYEGNGFSALGHHIDGNRILLDVLEDSDVFTSAGLWGPYDQVLSAIDHSSMYLLMGDGKKDGMGLLKSFYCIGYIPLLEEAEYINLGKTYEDAVENTMTILN